MSNNIENGPDALFEKSANPTSESIMLIIMIDRTNGLRITWNVLFAKVIKATYYYWLGVVEKTKIIYSY